MLNAVSSIFPLRLVQEQFRRAPLRCLSAASRRSIPRQGVLLNWFISVIRTGLNHRIRMPDARRLLLPNRGT